MKLISIAIPCYEMHGRGAEFLDFSFKKIEEQTYKNIQIVISDHSSDDSIRNLCNEWNHRLNIKYVKNTYKVGSSSANANNAIDNCDGEIIKILFQDDFLYHKDSLKHIVDNFNDKTYWLATACNHTEDALTFYSPFCPHYNDNIHKGLNTMSSPSVLSIRNTVKERFDDTLLWLMDCDYYKRLYMSYGQPTIVSEVNCTNRLWGKRLSDTIQEDVKNRELDYVNQKFS